MKEANLKGLRTTWFQLQLTPGQCECELTWGSFSAVNATVLPDTWLVESVGAEPRSQRSRVQGRLAGRYMWTSDSAGISAHTCPAVQGSAAYNILEKAKLWRQWRDHSGFQGWRWRERWMVRTQQIFLGQWNILYDIITVGTCHYIFVQTHRRYDTKCEL